MKTLNAILPNAGVAAAYRRELNALIDDLFETYRANLLSEIVGMAASGEVKAADAKPKTPEEAEEVFKAKAAAIAAKFAKKAGRHVEAGLIQAMKKAGFTQADLRKLRQDKTAYAAIEQQIINNNVALITRIPADVEVKIRKMVERSIEKGRDLGGLVKELDTLQEMTHRRSKFISIDQNNKVTNQMSLLKVQSLGITEGIWMHRGGAKVPRPTHLAMHGQRFNLSEGLFDEDVGYFVLPGSEINCHCTYKPVLPDIMQSGEPEPVQNTQPQEPEQEVKPEQETNEQNINEDPKLTALRTQERGLYERLDAFGKDRNKSFLYIYTNDEWDKRIKNLETYIKILEDPNSKEDSRNTILQYLRSVYNINTAEEARPLLTDMQSYRKIQEELFKVQKDISKIAGGHAASLEYVNENQIALRWDGGKLANEALAELHEGIRRAREQFPKLEEMQLTGSVQARQRQIKADLGRREVTSGMTYAYSVSAAKGSRYYPYNGIFLNESRFSPNAIAQAKWSLRKNVETGYHPVGCDTIKSIVDHEMAHQIDALIGAANDKVIRDIWNEFHGLDEDTASKLLSKYAWKDPGEMIAEAYAECENNKNPREYARKIVNRMKEIYKDKFGKQGV